LSRAERIITIPLVIFAIGATIVVFRVDLASLLSFEATPTATEPERRVAGRRAEERWVEGRRAERRRVEGCRDREERQARSSRAAPGRLTRCKRHSMSSASTPRERPCSPGAVRRAPCSPFSPMGWRSQPSFQNIVYTLCTENCTATPWYPSTVPSRLL
jgi:hypothetical protein